jgi:hypothetical protein
MWIRRRKPQCPLGNGCALGTDIIFEFSNASRPVTLHHGFQVTPEEEIQWCEVSHCPGDIVTCAFQLTTPFSMYKPEWCGFSDLLHFATVGHTRRLFHRHVNMATSPYGRVKSVAPQRLVRGTKFEHFGSETHDLQQLFPLYIFHILPTAEFSYDPGLTGHSV